MCDRESDPSAYEIVAGELDRRGADPSDEEVRAVSGDTPAPVAQPLSARPLTDSEEARLRSYLTDPKAYRTRVRSIEARQWIAGLLATLDAARSAPSDRPASYWMEFLTWEADAARQGGGMTRDQMTGAAIFRSFLVNHAPDDGRPEQPVPDNAALREALAELRATHNFGHPDVDWEDCESCGIIRAGLDTAPASPSGSSPVAAGLDVDRLAMALRRWELTSDPEALDVSARIGVVVYDGGEDNVARQIAREYAALASPADPHVRHGRHCPCSACAREDWTNPLLAPCDYHGVQCAYSPEHADPEEAGR